jgi:hypothetical protein
MFVASSEIARLLGSQGFRSSELDRAIQSGSIVQKKLEGVWLFHTAADSTEAALVVVETAVQDILHEYFIIGMPMLAGMVAKRLPKDAITWAAIKPLTRCLLRRRRFEAIGLLTRDAFQPYLAVHLPDDRPAISHMVDVIALRLAASGFADRSNVPNPERGLRVQGWKQSVLGYCEFLGLGASRDGSLIAWSHL